MIVSLRFAAGATARAHFTGEETEAGPSAEPPP